MYVDDLVAVSAQRRCSSYAGRWTGLDWSGELSGSDEQRSITGTTGSLAVQPGRLDGWTGVHRGDCFMTERYID